MLVLFRKTGNYSCSFCGKSTMDVGGLVASKRVRICDVCVADCAKALETPVESSAAAPKETTDLLAGLRDTQDRVDAGRTELRNQVQELRKRKVSWARIGESLGISRQAAWERFS